MKKIRSARGVETQRRSNAALQKNVKNSCKAWIDGLEALISVDYGDWSDEEVTMTVVGRPRKRQ